VADNPKSGTVVRTFMMVVRRDDKVTAAPVRSFDGRRRTETDTGGFSVLLVVSRRMARSFRIIPLPLGPAPGRAVGSVFEGSEAGKHQTTTPKNVVGFFGVFYSGR
jgi:hypothetical protein